MQKCELICETEHYNSTSSLSRLTEKSYRRHCVIFIGFLQFSTFPKKNKNLIYHLFAVYQADAIKALIT